jgi:flagellar biogenesis protein FliO
MASLGGLFVLLYLACVIAVIIYVLRLLGRLVSAHERVASALEVIARKQEDSKGDKP